MNQSEIENNLLETIDLMIHERFKELTKSNYYIEASITKNNGNSTYNLIYNDSPLLNIKARQGITLQVGDIVLVCVVNGNFSNKFIDLKRP
jgi:hypothetical protein